MIALPTACAEPRSAWGTKTGWLILGIAWLTAFSTRAGIQAVGPVLDLLIHDLNLTYAQGGALFAIPIVMLGIFAIPSGLLVARFGIKPVLIVSLALIFLGGGLRSASWNGLSLMAFTVAMGIGVGLAQPALPRLIRDWFADRPGTATGIYSSGFTLASILATGLPGPLLLPLSGHLTWRGPFLLWALVGGVTFLAVLPIPSAGRAAKAGVGAFGRLLRSPLTWLLAGIFVGQGIIYYSVSSILPSYYQMSGLSPAESLAGLAWLNVGGILGGICGPVLTDRIGRRKPVLLAMAVLCCLTLAGLLVAPAAVPWLSNLLLGTALTALFTICLVLPVDIAPREQVAGLTGIMLAVGYIAVGVGPTAVGFLRDVSGSFVPGLLGMVGIGLATVGLAALLPETLRRPG